ncbi:double-CXXCG motif protein [Cystobacter fuscus]|uniref:SitI6 family double-CXXCG motif immunity protein n=1 Tax=Cystobacter fuscus TaxID=43 RepID=UPI002B2E6ECA|nr:hypothetical protein F0U63_06860 [Cystobacter fuscus]
MTKFYRLRAPRQSRYTGHLSATHKWALPGLRCPECKATWAGGFTAYPGVDVSALTERGEYEVPRPEPFDEFTRLRERVRPLVPPESPLLPGTKFGPLVGTATGTFSPLFFYYAEMPLVHPEALERLRVAGVRGLRGFRTELRFRQRNPPELLELEIPPHGRLHPDCTPERPPRCPKCGWDDFAFPEDPILDAASLPAHTDLFRLSDFETIFIATERFIDTVRRLDLEEVDFRELPTR